MDYWKRTAPDDNRMTRCLEKELSRAYCNLVVGTSFYPKTTDPRYADGNRIYEQVAMELTPRSRQIIDDMSATGCP